MLTCHQGHDIIELYDKANHKCDCGNSRMPLGCQIPITSGLDKDFSNEKNVYNDTFFDIYCHCKKPYSEKVSHKFMIQCFNCEDWFHNTHLLPPILTKNIPEEYILICRKCAATVNLVAYTDFMYPVVKDNVEKYCLDKASDSYKRQRTDQ